MSSAPDSPALPPQGWYANPESSAQIRWWDGREWTSDTRPAESQAAAVEPPQPAAAAPPGDLGAWVPAGGHTAPAGAPTASPGRAGAAPKPGGFAGAPGYGAPADRFGGTPAAGGFGGVPEDSFGGIPAYGAPPGSYGATQGQAAGTIGPPPGGYAEPGSEDFSFGGRPPGRPPGVQWSSQRQVRGRSMVRVSVGPARGMGGIGFNRRSSGPLPLLIGGIAVIIFAIVYHRAGMPASVHWAIAAFGVFFVIAGAAGLSRRRSRN